MVNREPFNAENNSIGHEFRANIFDPHYAGVLRFLFKMTGSVQLAQDLTQEVFIKAYRHRESIIPEKTGKWLFEVGFNTAIDDKRRDRRRRAAILDNVKVDLSTVRDNSRFANPVETVLRGEEQAEIRAALEKLKPNSRRALVHFYWDGLSYAEISEVMEKPLGTIKSIISRGKLVLKKELRKSQPD